ncbi:hypothetical protein Q8G39_28590, partial [Klebsiella pneumoniae]|uniref:hypothetical protein n=1 Tax=Klebsiella pneumoniae TaxID=573 RepID=UPI003013FD4D
HLGGARRNRAGTRQWIAAYPNSTKGRQPLQHVHGDPAMGRQLATSNGDHSGGTGLHELFSVRRHQRFLLTTHIRPDGDAIGSM